MHSVEPKQWATTCLVSPLTTWVFCLAIIGPLMSHSSSSLESFTRSSRVECGRKKSRSKRETSASSPTCIRSRETSRRRKGIMFSPPVR